MLDTLFGGEDEDGPALHTTSGLGLEDYLKYRADLDKARATIKGQYQRAKSLEVKHRDELLQTYEKLYQHVLDRDAVLEQRKAQKNSETQGQGHAKFLLGGSGQEYYSPEEQEKQDDEYRQYMSQLLTSCEKLQDQYQKAEEDAQRQNSNLGNFLCAQGNIISSVDQAEAMDNKLKRTTMRKEAHKRILESLDSFNHVDSGGGVASALQQSLRDKSDTHADNEYSLRVNEVKKEFKKLEFVEERTDLLVDRLRVKLDAVNVIEESQVEMINYQVSLNAQTSAQINRIQSRVEANNEDIGLITVQIQGELITQLKSMSEPQSLLSFVLVIGLIFVFFVIVGFYLLSTYF